MGISFVGDVTRVLTEDPVCLGPVGLVLGDCIQEGCPPAVILLPQLHPHKISCLPAVIF